ncbi:MAG: HEAT repeat domain-containing protein, partial [Deltaproteobacteria bacterium]|nr:HEAT repeat domain-containing protein [Deltaproteobacteria bacterium]
MRAIRGKIIKAMALKTQTINAKLKEVVGWRQRYSLDKRVGAGSLAALLRATADPNAGVRGRALKLIASLGRRSRASAKTIVTLLTDPVLSVRRHALVALAATDTPEPWIVTTLERLARRGRDLRSSLMRVAIGWRIRLYAHAANASERAFFSEIGKGRGPRRVSALRKLAQHTTMSPAAMETFIVILDSEDEPAIAVALEALIRVGRYSS